MPLILLTACALAEEIEPTVYTAGDRDYILLADGTAEIVGYTGAVTELTIPTEHDGHAVTSFGDYALSGGDPRAHYSLAD